jgi:uncharacterized membrane protein YebE (DUF533 family)
MARIELIGGTNDVLNSPADVLSIVLRGTLGRSGRKRARKASRFLTGHKGFLSTSALIGMAGVAWGIYDTMKAQQAAPASPGPGVPPVPGAPSVPQAGFPPVPSVPEAVQSALDPVARVIRLAVSAAKADGNLSDAERTLILERAREAGLEAAVEVELVQARPLAEIVGGVTDPAMKNELYVLAYTIVRADETVSGAERIYLAQLAHRLGLDAASVTALETEISAKIDSQSGEE